MFKTTTHGVKTPSLNDAEFRKLGQGAVFTWPEAVFWYLKLSNGAFLALGSGQVVPHDWMVERAPARVILAQRMEVTIHMEESSDEVSGS